MQIALVSSLHTQPQAHATVRSVLDAAPGCTVHVLDLGGDYVATRGERVVSSHDVGIDTRELHLRSMLLEPDDLVRWVQPALLRHALQAGPTVISVGAGVVFLHEPSELEGLAGQHEVCVIARTTEVPPGDGRWPTSADLLEAGSHTPHLLAVSRGATDFLDLWEHLAGDPTTASDRWLDIATSYLPVGSVQGAHLLVSPWTSSSATISATSVGSLEVDGVPALAVDLTRVDLDEPWLLDSRAAVQPRVLLSAQPALAGLVRRVASEARTGDTGPLPTPAPPLTSVGVPVHPQLREVFRAALETSPTRSLRQLPDPFDEGRVDELTSWLVTPVADGGDHGLGRYLASIYDSRPDLRSVYPGVPGEHVGPFLAWVDQHGRNEPAYSSALIDLAHRTLVAAGRSTAPGADRGARRPGVNVVGYLRAELGVGESARLMLEALSAGGIAHATAAVDQLVQSRRGARFAASESDSPFDTTLLCVNADMTPTVAASVPSLLAHSYRIGMWYWEVEDFPTSQHEGFRHVDEVWVATDFVRRAIEPHASVPVRTITPPLPQARAFPARHRADLGLPDRPFFLFSFDYLSTVERKNPWGLVEAFGRAFAPGEGPLLVVKSINADRRPDQAERLRLLVAGLPDVVLLEDYLAAEDRDALVALCDCYVSLHRSEGLGLTMAEAMAYGKPVIATGYSGNLQFMTEANSFLVPWAPTPIPVGCEPYPPGATWAEPDLGAAAQLMRLVVADPERAKARGRQAAEDIRTLHSPAAAGSLVSARLAELVPARRARRARVARLEAVAAARRVLRR